MSVASTTLQYENAAVDWGEKVAQLGYRAAYGQFVQSEAPPLTAASQVCDIGTGCGTFAKAALENDDRPAGLTLVDPAAAMLDRACMQLAQSAAEVRCHQTTLEQFQDNQRYDLVLGAHVIEHCPDPVQALHKMYQLLAPGGTLLLVISRPHWCQWLIWLRWRHKWYSETRVRAMAISAALPAPSCYRFTGGPPQKTSFGYCFKKPSEGN